MEDINLHRLEAEIDRLNQELQRVTEDRDARRAWTCCVHAVVDPEDLNRTHVVRGTVEGIKALEAYLHQRFRDGVELGQAMADDRVEEKQSVIDAMHVRILQLEKDMEEAS